jgi:hypothetical protein
VTPNNPHFNFEALLLQAIEREGAIISEDEDTSDDDFEGEAGEETAHPPPTDPPPTANLPSTLSAADRRRVRKKSQGHKNRCNQHQKVHEESFSHHQLRPQIQKKYISTAIPTLTPMTAATSKVASTAYVALDDRKHSQEVYTLNDVVGADARLPFKLHTWDGR